jgi:spore coat polysaccharide biosynthesis protein SpsF
MYFNNSSFYVFVAVRMKSSRLKQKAMLNICGKPLIERLVERINKEIPLNRIVLCTSIAKQDDAIEEFSYKNEINCFRGHELDVMGRFLEAAELYGAKTIARVTGDNPLTDPFIMLEMLQYHNKTSSEYTFNNELPIGTRSEIIDIPALSRIHSQISDPLASEYMTYMLNRPDKLITSKYKIKNSFIKRPNLLLTVDSASDLEFIRRIYKKFDGSPPSLEKIIEWLGSEINNNYVPAKSTTLQDIDCSYIDD